MFSLTEAAKRAGISKGLLLLWVEQKKIQPSVDLSSPAPTGDDLAARALQAYLGPDGRAFENCCGFSDEDLQRLQKLVQETAERKTRVEEQHVKGSFYSVKELAESWSLSTDKIRELFSDEPDVIKIENPAKKGKRSYTTLRIPEKVAERVQRRLS